MSAKEATKPGKPCPACKTWIAAENLACICGFDGRREAQLGIASSLLAWVLACIVVASKLVFFFLLCVWPAGVLAVAFAGFGVRNGLLAVRVRGLPRVLGVVSLVLSGGLLLAPVVWLVARRFR